MIKVENLSRQFGAKRAVDGISFEVARGEVLGFLGPNGAGKSTTMRMITGYIPPTAGKVSVCGFDVEAQPTEAKRRIGYLPESAPLYSDMTVHSFLAWAAEMRGLTGADNAKAVARAVDMCSLSSVLHQDIDTLSKGFRHRTCLAQSIVHDPDVLIMDEPTDGLDPNQKFEVRKLIKHMGETKAIIFSTHILEEVEAACTRAIIIDRGRIVADGTPADLQARSENAGAVLLTLRGVAADTAKSTLGALGGVKRIDMLEQSGDVITIRAVPQTAENAGGFAARLADQVRGKQWTIDALRTEPGRLDDLFRSVTRSDTAHAGTTQGARA